ncbi:MAG: trypsin-like peptidase domain-containing protein [Elusimicrobia bacterium]|nr:trypsin-like peptidase domain-containing protein [Elusimicrobiota bacterium]
MQPYDHRDPDATLAHPRAAAAQPRWRAPLLAATLIASTLAGGAAGGVAATQWLAPRGVSAPLVTASVTPSSTPSLATSPSGRTATNAASIAAAVYARAGGSVVEVNVSDTTGRGNGSGFVVDAGGYILTNQHVVAGARTISVWFANGETRPAQVVGTDRGNDLAVLKVDLPSGVPAATLGDSAAVSVGDVAIAIGSPFGLEGTVTQGIVSAVDRAYQPRGGPAMRGLIQTDAPINPGNSGGPLLNADGEVIGITSLIESPVEGSVGIGFAIPIDLAKDLLPRLQTGARVEPVWLGISGIAVDPSIVAELGLPVDSGVLVASVVPGGPADVAGIRGGAASSGAVPSGGDVIVAVDGAAVRAVPDISQRIAGRKPGDTVRVTIVRGTERRDVTVALQAWPTERS